VLVTCEPQASQQIGETSVDRKQASKPERTDAGLLRRSRRLLVLPVAALAALAFAVVALGASPVSGGSYKGTIRTQNGKITLSFKVSSNGTRVTGMKLTNVPLYCHSTGPAIPIKFPVAAISSSGSFRDTAQNVPTSGPYKGQVATELKITGQFVSGGGEKGTLQSIWQVAVACSGKSNYTTKG
jgi:hypothetical protein